MLFFYEGNSLKSGIYEIRNRISNKSYIGQAKEFKERWQSHKNSLSKNKHKNKQNTSKTKKPIIAINILTKEEIIFPSLKNAEETLNIPNSNIYRILNGKQHQAKGWTFKRANI